MTEEELNKLEFHPDSLEWQAQFTVEAWESRFPGVLTKSGRYLMYHFILDALRRVGEFKKG